MPVWEDAERFKIEADPNDPDYSWSHVGMNVEEAKHLMASTLDDVRWKNDRANHLLWQKDYETPLLPGLSYEKSLWAEKLVERYAMLPTKTTPNSDLHQEVVSGLADLGVSLS